jgi:succinoglycan biosynthesis transport protein ExoP
MQGWTVAAQKAQPEVAVANAATPPFVVTPADLSKLLFKRKWIILIVVLVGTAIGVYHAETTTPLYEATSQIFIDLGNSNSLGIGNSQPTYMFDMPDVLLQTQVQIMRSDTVALEAIDALDLYHKAPFSKLFTKTPYTGQLTPKERAEIVGQFRGATKISVVPNTGLVNVSFTNQDPVVAKNTANAIVDAYMKRDLQARYLGTTRVSGW